MWVACISPKSLILGVKSGYESQAKFVPTRDLKKVVATIL